MLRVLKALFALLCFASICSAAHYGASSWDSDACNYYNGSAWVSCTKQYYSGAARVEVDGAPGADPSWTHFATAGAGEPTTASSIAVTVNSVPAGALAVVYVSSWSSALTVTGVSDGTSAFTSTTASTSSDLFGQHWYLLSTNSGNRTYTATFSGTADGPIISVQIITYSGTIVYDTGNRAGANSTSIASGNISTTGTYPITFFAAGTYSARSISSQLIGGAAISNWTEIEDDYRAVGLRSGSVSSGAGTGTIDTDNPWIASLIAFKEQ